MIKIAIIGATGAVGRQMIDDVEKTNLNIDLKLFASPKSEGAKIKFRDKTLIVKAFDINDLKDREFVLMSAGGTFSKTNAKKIAETGCTVIDNSSAWRMEPDVPLVVPEVNSHVLKNFKTGIIANPNCSTIQLVVSINPLHKKWGIEELFVTTLQSVSGSGQKGILEFQNQINQYIKNEPVTKNYYPKPIAFNVIPAIDVLDEEGHCFEEVKIINETKKILEDSTLKILATTTRVPTFYCHCESIVVKLKKEVSVKEILDVLEKAEGVVLRPQHTYDSYPINADVHMDGRTWVCRVRLPYNQTKSCFVQFWNIADNLKKGAATNAVQIMQTLLKYKNYAV